ncbi:MAG: DUF3822 family protein [Muribaculaceae bacterium]|nr:DUF3822 family protein [Muribaculaceae bacterium]
MNDSSTYQAVRIGDIAEWKLICVISESGMSAYLKHSNPTQDVISLFDESWDVNEETLLERIENVVYDHPQVLDDFSADIAVVAPKSIWVPTELVHDREEDIPELYNNVYSAADEDVMADEDVEATCLFSLVPGLRSFLQRTFPGARIHSHLAVMTSRFRDRSSDMPRVYIDIRHNWADFVAFDRRNLLMAASHPWKEPSDIEYSLFNILNVYGLDPEVVQVSLSGPRDVKNPLMHDLRKYVTYVMLTMMPGIGVKAGMPLIGALLMRN